MDPRKKLLASSTSALYSHENENLGLLPRSSSANELTSRAGSKFLLDLSLASSSSGATQRRRTVREYNKSTRFLLPQVAQSEDPSIETGSQASNEGGPILVTYVPKRRATRTPPASINDSIPEVLNRTPSRPTHQPKVFSKSAALPDLLIFKPSLQRSRSESDLLKKDEGAKSARHLGKQNPHS
jgi:hypothetical protein